MSWRPLLEGELASRAEEAVRAIGEALASWQDAELGPSVSGGTAGLALFYGYLGGHEEQADALLDHALDALATTPMTPALHGGFTGIAWAAEHLGSNADADDDLSEEIDETVCTALAAPWTGDYDLISGLVGFGVYALERIHRPSARRCLEAIVDRLHESAETVDDGVTWFTPPELLPPRNRAQHPRGYYNLGVAHGVPGVIALLAGTVRHGVRAERARPLLDGAVRWVLAQRLDGRGYPASVMSGVEAKPARLAWCYGAPGVAATLLDAARAVGNEEWEHAALDIAREAAGAAPQHSGVQDAGLCHGALGLAHLYNRIYQAGGGEPFADAARFWYAQGLDMRQPDRGIAGFESWEFGPDMKLAWQADRGFLCGAAGIGLALLAGLTSTEPQWDRLLMVSGLRNVTRA